MRPISLQIEGFTCFRQNVLIDFSSLDLFAITGPTGAGKTSIIDAMTYALYGCTPRMGVGQVSELISQGMNRMSVLFHFRSGSHEYRIARSAKWGKQTTTELRLEQRAGDEWVSLADGVNAARPLIEQIIGLDFNGFTKSVVLPQGQFDLFLKGKPEDRRKILSDLLDLDIYSRMMRRANEIAKEQDAQAKTIEGVLKNEYADATSENLERQQKDLEKTEPQLPPIDAGLQHVAQFLPVAFGLRQARLELSKAEVELKSIIPKRKTAEADLERASKRVEDVSKKAAEIASALQRNKYDSSLHSQMAGALEKARRLEAVATQFEVLEKARKDKADKQAKLNKELKRLEDAATAAEKAMVAAKKEADKDQNAIDKFRKKYGSPDAVKGAIDNLKQFLKQQQSLARLQVDSTARENDRKKLDEDIVFVRSKAVNAQKQFDDAHADYEALVLRHSAESLKPALRAGEPCPVCEQVVQSVPKKRKHEPLQEGKRHQKEAESALRAVEKRVLELEAQAGPLDREIVRLRKASTEATEAQTEILKRLRLFTGPKPDLAAESDLSALHKQFVEAQSQAANSVRRLDLLKADREAAFRDLLTKQNDLRIITNDLERDDSELSKLQKESEKLRDHLGELASLKKAQAAFDKQEQLRVEREYLLRHREQRQQDLAQAEKDRAAELLTLERFETTRKSLEQSRDGFRSQIEEMTASLTAEFPDLKKPSAARDEATQLEQRQQDLQHERTAVHTRISALRNEIKMLEQKLVRAVEMRAELEQCRIRTAVARTLWQALQGDNFIAFIQGEAYARLAFDGSAHLKTLTADRYSFSVDKDEFQVVDHWNADEPRPVTTLSGGESFLASLALALALAEGLSGLSSGHTKFTLESLFLDEGFGTLDPETLEYVVSGIEGLSANDRLIGIISHIPELAERMPARINVKKTVGGSSIEVS